MNLIDKIIEIEGGYVNDPNDSGGETNFGITIAVARDYGYQGEMKDLPRELAVEIYKELYWHPLKGDDIEALSPMIWEEMLDTSINMGVGRAAGFLQRSLTVLNVQGQLYADLTVDRQIGPKTLNALRTYLTARKAVDGEMVLYKMLNCLQGAFYVDLAERREKDETFIFGWYRARVS